MGPDGAHGSDAARHHLARRLDRAVAALEDPATPMVVVDLDAFDANAADLVRRAARQAGPGRLEVAARPGAGASAPWPRPGFAGVLAYSLREALWLVREGLTDDVVMGYPTVDRVALADLLGDDEAASASR